MSPKAIQSATSRDSFLTFGSPLIEAEEIEEVNDCLRSGWLGTGPKVARFEDEFSLFKSAKHAIAVNSGTAALHLSLLASGIKPGDEVITSALTFCATVNAIIHAGATPVLADVDPMTMNISPDSILRKITSRTKAIIVVHFAGRACEMDRIVEITQYRKLMLIEDCAHAIETEYKGAKSGSFGSFGCFSFYVTKNVITGEGGMVVTQEGEHAARIKTLALHGMSKDAWKRFGDAGYQHYDVLECGFKYNMMDIQAAIGLHQLRRVEKNWARRKQIWGMYNRELAGIPITLPEDAQPDERHAYHLYPILIDERAAEMSRDEFLTEMNERKIGVGVHYRSIPEHSYYQNVFKWMPEDVPEATSIGRRTISLPLSAKLSDHDVVDVIEAVHATLGK